MRGLWISWLFLTVGMTRTVFCQDIERTVILDSIVIEDVFLQEVNYAASNYISKSELRNAQVRDAGEYLRSIPNVSGIRKGGANLDPVVRGYKFSQLNVLLNNGVKIENGCPNRMDPVSAHIETEDIGNIEVIKGPFLLKYGPSFGGVINLISEIPGNYDKFEVHGNGQSGFESNWKGSRFHGSIYGGNKRWSFMASGGYKDYGDYTSGGGKEDEINVKSSFTKYNYLAKLGYTFKQNQSILISYDGVHGRDVMYPSLPMDEASDDTHIFSLDYKAIDLTPVFKNLIVKAYRSDVHHIMDNARRPSASTMLMVADVKASNTGSRAEATFQLANHRILAGMDYEDIRKDGARTGIMEMMGTVSRKVTNLWLDASIRNIGYFAEYKTFFSSYELYASIRGDLNRATSGDTLRIEHDGEEYYGNVNSQFLNISFSIGMTRKIRSNMDLSLAFGRGIRCPNMLERFIKLLPVGYDRYDYLGNPQLRPEINNELDLTYRYHHEYFGQMYLNLFYSYVEDFITGNLLPPSVIKPQSQGVLGVKQFYNADHIISTGFEFGYNTPSSYKWGGNVTAAFSYAWVPGVTQYVISDGEVIDAIEISKDALPEIPPFEATAGVYYKFFKTRIVPDLKLRMVAAQRHVSEAFYEEETPGFAVLDFSVRWKVTKFIELNTGILNILNRFYYEHLNRRIIGSNENLYEPGRVFFASVFAHF